MKLHTVEAISKSSGSKTSKKKEQGTERKWSLLFLDVLAREFEKEEQENKKKRQSVKEREERGSHTPNFDEEYDCRIVEKGKEEIPLDWDSFEVTRDFTEPVLESELYEDIIDCVKSVGNWQANILYKIANTIMQDYYSKALGIRAVGELFSGCYQKCVENNKKVIASKARQQEILEILYEYFSRANARKSVAANERAGRKLVEGCGLSWAGTTYYDSQYYYSSEKLQRLFQKLCKEMARKYGLKNVPFTKIEKRTQFFHVGGISYHSVYVWIQQKDNYPSNQYGMRDIMCVPPRQFRYLYRNHCAKNEKTCLLLLEQRMRQQCDTNKKHLWRSYILEDGRDYHNGMSYLLEGSMLDEEDEENYASIMAFLQNFRLFRTDGCVEYLLSWDR